jgi:hypothetical protein
MSNSPSTSSGAASAGPGADGISSISSQSPRPASGEPVTQEKKDFRKGWPIWAKQFPRFKFPPPNADFELIDPARLDDVLKGSDPQMEAAIKEDIQFLEHELLRFFRDRDYEASKEQNQYRLYQLGYISLAALATLIGSLQALSLSSKPELVPFFAFLETLIALIATFLATISGREPPLPLWLTNRRRAESLRREYFRYLMNMPPYDGVAGFERRRLLSTRAADINRGVFPPDEAG